MATTTAVRGGTTIWLLDPTHSSVEFSVKHMMMTTVRGRFKDLKATLTGDRDHPDEAGVEAAIEAASIDTGVADRDGHLRAADFSSTRSASRRSLSAARESRTRRRTRGTAFA